jgi:hypothetical protein
VTSRTQSRLLVTLVVELVLVAVLAGFGPDFPRDVSAGSAWRFVGSHAPELAHAVLGALLLVQTVALLLVARPRLMLLIVACGLVTAVASGGVFVSRGQAETALTAMTIGWLTALAAAVAELVRQRRRAKVAAA